MIKAVSAVEKSLAEVTVKVTEANRSANDIVKRNERETGKVEVRVIVADHGTGIKKASLPIDIDHDRCLFSPFLCCKYLFFFTTPSILRPTCSRFSLKRAKMLFHHCPIILSLTGNKKGCRGSEGQRS